MAYEISFVLTAVLFILIWLIARYSKRRSLWGSNDYSAEHFVGPITIPGEFNVSGSTMLEAEPKLAPITASPLVEPLPAATSLTATINPLITMSVMAKTPKQFASYELLQSIAAAGLQFGEMNIFHYQHGNEILFSLASATPPGEFNLNDIGNFSCPGLVLFLDTESVSNPLFAFEKMVGVAHELCDELDGVIRLGYHEPWNSDVYHHLYQQLENALPM